MLEVLVHYYFFVFRGIGEYISLDLFYFVNLTSSCSLIPLKHISSKYQFASITFEWNHLVSEIINPFTAPACEISGLKDTQTRLQAVYFPDL